MALGVVPVVVDRRLCHPTAAAHMFPTRSTLFSVRLAKFLTPEQKGAWSLDPRSPQLAAATKQPGKVFACRGQHHDEGNTPTEWSDRSPSAAAYATIRRSGTTICWSAKHSKADQNKESDGGTSARTRRHRG